MLRLTNYSDSNGSYTIEMPTQADWINSIALSANTPNTDTIPAGARFVILNATNTLYVRIGATVAGVPATISTGAAPELMISSTSGWPIARTWASPLSIVGSIAATTNTLTVSQQGFNPAGLASNYSPTDGFTIGDTITVAGAGAAGAVLTTTITGVNTSTNVLTLTATASTTVTNSAVAKSFTTICLVSPGTCIVTLMYYK